MFPEKKVYQKIVTFKKPAMKANELSPEYKTLLLRYGAFKIDPLPLINGALCYFSPSTSFQTLAELDEVVLLEDNLKVKLYPVLEKSKSLIFDQYQHQVIPWGTQRIGANKIWSISKGEEVKVGILDTGVEFTHLDLRANIRGGINLLAPGNLPNDDNGHGTHVTGIVAAEDNGFGIVGVSPRVHIYVVKVLDVHGEGYFANVIRGLSWCKENGIDIINLSFGSDQPSQALHEAVRKVVAAGKIIVAAAGNDGSYQSVDYPAAYPEVIAVGAVNEYNQVTPFSSRGPQIKLVAPGANILSTGVKGFFQRMSGTSMAAAHVTGAVAILKHLTQASFQEILRILTKSAERLPFLSNEEQGSGLVRIDQAVSLSSKKNQPASVRLRPVLPQMFR